MASTAATAALSLIKSTGGAAVTRASFLPIPSTAVSARRLGFSAVVDSRFSVHVASKVQSVRGKGTRGVITMAKKSVGDLTSADLKGKKVFEGFLSTSPETFAISFYQ